MATDIQAAGDSSPRGFRLQAALESFRALSSEVRAWSEVSAELGRFAQEIAMLAEDNELILSTELGDAGFLHVQERKEIHFNQLQLERVLAAAQTVSLHLGLEKGDIDELLYEAATLYLAHEIAHISQNFGVHGHASSIKAAFGPEELSRMDVFADIMAAHYCTITKIMDAKPFNSSVYLQTFSVYVRLSFEILRRGFPPLSPAKKKRALGLLTNMSLAEVALQPHLPDQVRGRARELAFNPAFTSIEPTTKEVVAQTAGASGGWNILFVSGRSDNFLPVQTLWDELETAPVVDCLDVLIDAYHSNQAN